MKILLYILCALGYIVIGGLSAWLFEKFETGDENVSGWLGIMWPITTPVLILQLLFAAPVWAVRKISGLIDTILTKDV